jgi:phospholipid/cholesterol/gamma-HCH transport system substrate-binding protein
LNGSVSPVGRETIIGALVLVIGIGILALAYAGSAQKNTGGYELTARFAKAEGVAVGTEVQLAGVPVGEVTAQTLDPRFQAVLTLRLASSVQLPTDSAALIQTNGLLGSKFIALQPGSDDKNLKPGSQIEFTQSSISLTDILDLIISQAESHRPPGSPPPPTDLLQ